MHTQFKRKSVQSLSKINKNEIWVRVVGRRVGSGMRRLVGSIASLVAFLAKMVSQGQIGGAVLGPKLVTNHTIIHKKNDAEQIATNDAKVIQKRRNDRFQINGISEHLLESDFERTTIIDRVFAKHEGSASRTSAGNRFEKVMQQ